ncbi:MAG: AEC family transporter [Oscillospiraceae bacterium]|nr:AEC family transporter [Oscillospiraceae bacterium]
MDNSVFLVGGKVLTLFLIVFAGIIARKMNILDWASTKKLSAFLLNVTQPLMIITSFQIDFDAEKLKQGVSIFILSAAIHIFLAAAAFLLYKPVKNLEQRKIFEMATIFTNCAFLGYPVLKVVFGDELGIFYGAFYSMFFNIFIWTYGIILLSRGKNKNGEKVKLPISKIFINAGMISSFIGIIIFAFRIKIPPILFDSAKLIGDMTFPLSMVIIGSLISTVNLKRMFLSVKNYYYLIIKLIVMPLFIGGVCWLLKLPTLLIYMGALMPGMPSAANVAIFAETYECDAESGATDVGLSTLFSIVSVPFVIFVLSSVLRM